LREAREKMNKIYPLTPDLWREWIADEQSVASTEEHARSIMALYDRATADYFDVDLWLDYVQFSTGLMPSIGLDGVRRILDRSLLIAGLHVPKGALIWGFARDFEAAIMATYGPIDDNNRDQYQQQIKRIYDIFRRQLSVPLVGMEKAYQEFEGW